MNPYSRPQQGNGAAQRAGAPPRWNLPGVPPLPMWNGPFPPLTPEMALSMGIGLPPGFLGMRPPGMLSMDPNFPVPMRPSLPGERGNNAGFPHLNGDRQGATNGDNNNVPTTRGGKARCRHWPKCNRGRSCPYIHPTRICSSYPNCRNDGTLCTFIHPDVNPEEAQRALETGGTLTEPTDSDSGAGKPAVQNNQWPPSSTSGPGFPGTFASAGSVPCKFGENCSKPSCTFVHPSKRIMTAPVCKFFPNCANTACPYTHPSQKGGPAYGASVTTEDDTEMSDAPEPKSAVSDEVMDRPLSDIQAKKQVAHSGFKKSVPCRDGAACTRPACYFTHPWDKSSPVPVACRYGNACTRMDCPFQHPRHQNRSMVFNKPNQQATQQHVSERTFSLPNAEEQIVAGPTASGADMSIGETAGAGEAAGSS